MLLNKYFMYQISNDVLIADFLLDYHCKKRVTENWDLKVQLF